MPTEIGTYHWILRELGRGSLPWHALRELARDQGITGRRLKKVLARCIAEGSVDVFCEPERVRHYRLRHG